jgi:hypothetical protein
MRAVIPAARLRIARVYEVQLRQIWIPLDVTNQSVTLTHTHHYHRTILALNRFRTIFLLFDQRSNFRNGLDWSPKTSAILACR